MLFLRFRKSFVAFSLAGSLACSAMPDVPPRTIRCETEGGILDVLRLNLLTGEAVLLSVSPVRTGKVEVRSSEYEVLFEASETALGLWIRVNRYTGKGERELGSPPFGTLSLESENLFNLTTCELYNGENRL